MAKAKKALRKTSWTYYIDNYDESFQLFPSRAAALECAKRDVIDNYDQGEHIIYLFEQVEAVRVAVDVVEEEVVVTRSQNKLREVQ